MVVFQIRFADGSRTSAEELWVPLEDLRKHENTYLGALSKPVWRMDGPAENVVEFKATEVLEENWTAGMGEAVRRWYARGDAPMTLPAGVELQEFVAVAEFFLLDLGDVSTTLTFGDDDDDDGRAFVRNARAQTYLKRRESIALAVAHVKHKIFTSCVSSMRFAVLHPDDDVTYVNSGLATKVQAMGVSGVGLTADQKQKFGTRGDH